MTTACYPLKSAFFTPDNHGVSEGARQIGAIAREIFNDCSQSISGQKDESIQELYSLSKECSDANWDGFDASPINMESFIEAQRFIYALPTTIAEPEVSVDPDGEISLEWYLEPRRVFSVSIGKRNEVTYAGLFGINKSNGKEYFGDEIPKTILENLDRLYS